MSFLTGQVRKNVFGVVAGAVWVYNSKDGPCRESILWQKIWYAGVENDILW